MINKWLHWLCKTYFVYLHVIFLNKMEGDMAHGITELVKGTLFPQFWLFHCWGFFYQVDFFLYLLKLIYCITHTSFMRFLFVIWIFFLIYEHQDFQAS